MGSTAHALLGSFPHALFSGSPTLNTRESTVMFGVDMAGEKQISTVKRITESSFVSPMHRRLLTEWNDTETDLPQDNCVHELFETQVERAPNAVALVYNKGEVSYRELDNQANQVAPHLRSLCVGPD